MQTISRSLFIGAALAAAREVGARGVVLFSYNSAVRPSELNPDGAYPQRVMRAAFPEAGVGKDH